MEGAGEGGGREKGRGRGIAGSVSSAGLNGRYFSNGGLSRAATARIPVASNRPAAASFGRRLLIRHLTTVARGLFFRYR